MEIFRLKATRLTCISVHTFFLLIPRQLNIVNNTAKYPGDIRVIRTYLEVPDDDTIQDTFIWYNFVQIITDKTRYPKQRSFWTQV